VGAYEQAMGSLKKSGLDGPLAEYVRSGRPFLGICLGLQLLFDGSEENGGVAGLGLIPGTVRRFTCDKAAHPLPVPHIGWNDLEVASPTPPLLSRLDGRRVYFVHSYRAVPTPSNAGWVAATSDYGGPFIAAVRRGAVCATQFHPEKSGGAGLDLLRGFLEDGGDPAQPPGRPASSSTSSPPPPRARGLARRVIACLDVRANDAGDLVVTKGDQYDVRESADVAAGGPPGGSDAGGDVRNLGKPVELARRYYEEGADEVAFLNITGFRETPLGDLPMLEVLRQASEGVFVPLTVGGGIRGTTDPDGTVHTALAVAAEYFRSGADKVSIGSDAVEAALAWYARGKVADGSSAIEQISWVSWLLGD
jgi:glutamine amidotransferase/cyclase